MNDPTKHIRIDSSSLVSLKAELSRKQLEFQQERQRAQSDQIKPIKKKIKKIKDDVGNKNPGVDNRASKDAEQRIEEAKELINARNILEKKAKMYEAMSRGEVDDEDENILVDFHRKEVTRRREEEEEIESGVKKKDPTAWENTVRLRGDRAGLGAMSGTGHDEQVNNDRLNVHYTDVTHNEIREHGVGFYQLSGEEEKRREQMEMLDKLRTQTVEQKLRKEKFKEKRAQMMEERLAKMRKRRGLPDPPPPAKAEEPDKAETEPAPLTRDDTWRKTAKITRDWDKGKKVVVEDYETKRRNERLSEFAPPSYYSDDREPSPPPPPPPQSKPHKNKKPYSKKTNTKQEKNKTDQRNKQNVSVDITQQLKELRSEVEKGVEPSKLEDISSIPLPPDPSLPIPQTEDKTGQNPVNFPDNFPPIYMENPQAMDSPVGISYPPPPFPFPYPPPPVPSQGVTYPPPPPLGSLPSNIPTYNPSIPPPPLPTLPPQSQPNPISTPENFSVNLPQKSHQSEDISQDVTAPDQAAPDQAAPQPAHYSSAPKKVQDPGPRYERVHLHTVPLNLPAPPTSSHIPKYNAQEGNFIPENRGQKGNKKNLLHMWKQTYKYNDKDGQ